MMDTSIAMAIYNGERWLREQLDSLAHQTLLPTELVVSDDLSTDGTLDVVRRFASTSPFPVRVLRNKLRRGFADNFIHALRSCSCAAVAYCDQDDVWNPSKLERCVSVMQRDPGITLVHHDSEEVDSDLRPLGIILRTRSRLSAEEQAPHHRVIRHPAQGCSMLVRRCVTDSLLSFWPESNLQNVANSGRRGDLAHDMVTLHLASILGRVVYLPDLLIKHRRHLQNTWSPELGTLAESGTADSDGRVATLEENARSGMIRASMYEEMSKRARTAGAIPAARYLAQVADRDLKSARFFSGRGKLYGARSLPSRFACFLRMLRAGCYTNLGGALVFLRCTFKDLAFVLIGPVAARLLENLRRYLHLDLDPRELFESAKAIRADTRLGRPTGLMRPSQSDNPLMAIATPPSTRVVSEVRDQSPICVLFFDHTAALGGGEIAMANLISHLDRNKVKPLVVLGAEGPLADRLRPTTEIHVLPLSAGVTTQKKDTLGFVSLFRVREALSICRYVLGLARFIHTHDVALVHTNSLKADIIGGLAGRLARRPVVWHVRDRIEDDYLPKCAVRIFRRLSRVIPHYVIANSAATLRSLSPRKGAGPAFVPPGRDLEGKCAVVHDGTGQAFAEKLEPRQELHVGLIGRISPWKGQHIFIRAAALVHRHFPDARFFIIGAALFGEDRYDREVRRLPGRLGIESVVTFTGFRSDVQRATAELDVVVHASTKGEPFGQVIVEAMAAGKPVVATDGGGVPEIVLDGLTGILVPMGDAPAMAHAVCRILSDPSGAKAMGERARQRVADHFTLAQTARRVEAVYTEMSNGRAQ